MAITRKDVLHVAELARLTLSENEVDRMVADLGKILAYVDELSALDTTNVPPTTYSVDAAPLRRDAAVASLPQATALSEAPRRSDGGFAVPAFVEDA